MKTKSVRLGRTMVLVLIAVLVLEPQPAIAATCTWQGGGSGDWNLTTNWSCGAVPGTSDVVQFNSGGTVTVTAVPTQSIAQLLLSNNTTVNLQASAASTTLTIAGASETDLDVPSGSALNMNGATNILTIFLGAGATGSISGSMTCSTAAHRLNAQDASAITFNSGATFTQTTGCTSNVFTASGTANVIVFASGSTFVSQDGGNPFGLEQPSSKVVFQSGSLYRHEQATNPSCSGRTYANFELNRPGGTNTGTGSYPLSIDNLTVTAGTLNMGMTGTFNLKGNISVASGAVLNFNPASVATVTFNGSSAQTIGGAGTLTFQSNQNVTINNSNGVTLQRDVTLNGVLNLTSGDLNTGSNTLTLGSNATVTGTTDVVGNVKRVHSFTAGTSYAFGNPFVMINFASGGTLPSDVTVTMTKTAPSGLTTAVQRYYTVTSTGGSGYSATLRLHYLDSELGGTTEDNLQLWRYNGTRWILQTKTDSNTTDNWLERSGVTEFSDWAITDSGAPTAVTLSTFTARTETPAQDVLAIPPLGLAGVLVAAAGGVWLARRSHRGSVHHGTRS